MKQCLYVNTIILISFSHGTINQSIAQPMDDCLTYDTYSVLPMIWDSLGCGENIYLYTLRFLLTKIPFLIFY